MKKKHVRKYLALATGALWCVLVVALLLNVGCSSTEQPSNSMTLRVGQNSLAFSYFPTYVAQQQHYFTEQGLTFAPDPMPIMGNGTKTTAAFLSGTIDVGIGTITDAYTLSRVDANLRIIGTFSNAFAIDVVASHQFLQHTHLTEASPLQSKVKALLGRKIGISAPGSATEALLVYVFRKYGYDYTTAMTEVNLGNVTAQTALAALSSGKVDAVSWPIPAGQQAQKNSVGSLFISPLLGDVPEISGMVYGVLYSSTQVIEAKPRAIAALIRAFAQAENFIHKEPAQATALLATFLRLDARTTAALARTALASIPATPLIDQRGYDIADQFHAKAGLIAIALPYNGLVSSATIMQALTPVATQPK